jgi:hypothetical protein
MGASAREIERQIRETRDRMDENLTQLEGRTRSAAMHYGRFAAIGLGALLVVGAAFLVYRRARRPTLRDRLDELSLDKLRTLATHVREQLPSVTVRVNEKTNEGPGTIESIVREVAPALVGTAGTVLVERLTGARDDPAAE